VLGDKKIPLKGEILNLEGACLSHMNSKKALELHNEALKLYKELDNKEGEANTLAYIAEALIENDAENYTEVVEILNK
jgi:hypothetical protein